ncbi:hypothetical protein [Fodinibius salsisoli]|uniref:Uncharacterized protein n=1 Tax=Fodinibius salsisoli TaxID=2820877 RepID=A0ABT3PIM5_9BACT|nr:hypothetical protein [Fodinibius salsisoli]MCW9705784.1 hypothetical protein [Fodinibius salsisoli]
MELVASEVYEVLQEKGVEYFHHANTVRTACSFLSQGKLLSRGVLDELGLPQTDQQSDDKDKSLSLWYDVFLDGIDIHYRSKGRNYYGPVLFRINLEVLLEDWLASLWITKGNPQDWETGTPQEERYYQSIDEFREYYRYGNFNKMFVLRHVGGVIRLDSYLDRINIDNPKREVETVNLYDQAVGALKASARAGGLGNIQVARHLCKKGCDCTNQYQQMKRATVKKFFLP